MISLGIPYKANTAPQRFQILHSELNTFDQRQYLLNSEIGYYIFPFDRHGVEYIKNEVPLLKVSNTTFDYMKESCDNKILCGIPHYLIYYVGSARRSLWIERTDRPKFDTTPKLENILTENISENQTRYLFRMTGTHHMSLHISPLPTAKLISWSFLPTVDDDSKSKWNDRDVYFINYVKGLDKDEIYEFELVFEKPVSWTQNYTFDIALVAQFIHKPTTHTMEFEQFLSSFPSWTTLQYWTNYYALYPIE